MFFGRFARIFVFGKAWMAQEFLDHNSEEVCQAFAQAPVGIPVAYQRHVDFKKRCRRPSASSARPTPSNMQI